MPSAAGIVLLRLLLRFRRSLSKQTAKHGRGGPRARCCWNLFAETSPEISGKSQEKIRKQCRGGPRARCCRDCFVDSSAAISEKSRQQNQQTVQRRSPHAVMLGLFLLRLLLRFRRSLSNKSANSAAAVPLPGAVGILLLRLRLRFRRSLSKQISQPCRTGPVSRAVGILC